MLYRVAMTHTGNPADAEDVLHDVFTRLLDRAPHFRDELHEKHWLLRVTVNLCHNKVKTASRRNDVPLFESIPAPEDSALLAVKTALQKLPAKQKDVIYLHYYEGYSVEEIAKILKIGVSAVKMRLSRARDALKLELE